MYRGTANQVLATDAGTPDMVDEFAVEDWIQNTRLSSKYCNSFTDLDTGKTNSYGRPETLLLATNRLDLDAELVALGYRYRWAIELFFRWFKCILGCKHLLSTDAEGITIQVYLGIIASLLISIWTGKKPTKRTWEMLQFYFSGWATEDELMQRIQKLQDHPA